MLSFLSKLNALKTPTNSFISFRIKPKIWPPIPVTLTSNTNNKRPIGVASNRNFSTTSNLNNDTLKQLQTLKPNDFLKLLESQNVTRCFITNKGDQLCASHEFLQDWLDPDVLSNLEYDKHEAIFFGRGTRTNCLLTVFLWRTSRGQGVGGVDLRNMNSMADLLAEGNRFSKNLGIKSALAGLWAGGGKGIIVPSSEDDNHYLVPSYRQEVFADFGEFLTSLNGCMVAGAGVGSSVPDMDSLSVQTRYVTNMSPDYGGSTNSAYYTALGVVTAMEATLDFLNMGSLEGKTVAMQGTGNVGAVIIKKLLEKGIRHIYATDLNTMRVADLTSAFADKADGRLTITKVSANDTSIYRQQCDIFSTCARGKVINSTTIPLLNTRIICGASNSPVDTEADHQTLYDERIFYVTDVVPNRMGIVSKVLEPFGRLQVDPEMQKHLSKDWDYSIYQTTLKILEYSERKKVHPERAAYILGEKLSNEDNPLYPNRTRHIIQALVDNGWHEERDFWRERLTYLDASTIID